MIADKLRLDGDSLVSFYIRKGDIDESEKYFKALSTKLSEKFYPELTYHLEKLNVNKLANDCKTIEELQVLRFPVTADDLPTKLTAELDLIEELDDAERHFTFIRVFDILVGGAFGFVQNILQQRARALQGEKSPKSRIIMP